MSTIQKNRIILIQNTEMYLVKILVQKLKSINSTNVRIVSSTEEEPIEYNKDTDLIIQQYDPELSSVDNFKILKDCKQNYSHTSFIFIGPAIGEMAAVKCIKQGADDYILLNQLDDISSIVEENLSKNEKSDELIFRSNPWGQNLESVFDQSYAALKDKLEKQLHFNEKLMEMLPADIYLSDLSIRPIRFFNMNILNRFGYTQKDFERPGELLSNFVHPDDIDNVHAINYDIFTNQEDQFFDFEYRVRDKEGNWHWLHSREVIFKRDAEGFASHILGVNYDISELKKVQKELAEKNENLEAMVAARTFALQQSNEDLERFAFIASHDLQEPLRMIISYLQLFKRSSIGQLNEEQLTFLGFAEEGAQRMHHLLLNLLEYSRLTSEKTTFKEVGLDEILAEIIRNLSAQIEETQAVIKVPILPKIIGHKSQLIQVFQNLISNAIKFQHQEAVPKVSITYREEKNRHVFAVKDNGIGIEEEFQDQIFQAFKRLNSRQKYKGSGVGLSICKKIITNHFGEMWLESYPNLGTTFFFSISKELKLTDREKSSSTNPMDLHKIG